MTDITELLRNIKTKVYGKDVRQAIHDAIQQCYLDGKVGAIDMVARNQISNLVAENNDTSGNSELTDIRVGVDGTRYGSAGEAVRKQVGSIKTSQKEIREQVPILTGHMNSARKRMTEDKADMRFFSYGSISSSGEIIDSQKEIVSVLYSRHKNESITPPDGYEVRIASYYSSNGSLNRIENWTSNTTMYSADNDSVKDRVSIRRKDGGDITTDELVDKISTTISDLKAFYKIDRALNDLKKELRKENESVSDEVDSVRNDLESAPDKIVNMHVWEKFSSNLTPNLAAEKALSLGSWMAGIPGMKPDFVINYSDGIGKTEGEIVLADPVRSFHVTNSSDYEKLNSLRGKYVKKASAEDGIFKVATNASFYVVTEKKSVEMYVMKCSSAQHVDSVGYTASYGHVTSADQNAYPNTGLQDGFRYEYKGTIGQTVSKSGVMEDNIESLTKDVDYLKKNCTGGSGSSGGTGSNGKDGVGILRVEQTTTSTEDGGTNIVTVTKTNGEKSTFQVRNGSKGSKVDKGDAGEKGEPGAKGDTGVTPNITIGTVNTLESGQSATASITGTTENPVLNLGIPKGAAGSGNGSGTVDTSKTFMTGLHVYSTEVLADLDNMEDNRAYLISCHGVKNVPIDGNAMACSVGFSNKYIVHVFTSLGDNRTFIRTKNGTSFGSWKELQNNESSNVEVTESPYKGKTIVAFGDSIIAGWGWKEGTGIIQPLKEKYPDATWINKAESGANMAVTSSPAHTPIVNQITSYTGAADAIILDGGVNDKNNGISIGSITAGYDATYDTSTFCGALESSLQYIMDRYPLAVKLYIIPHSFGKDNSFLDSIYEKAIEICKKWNMPYLDMRVYSQIAMTSANKDKYTYNPNSKKGDGVHPNETWYRTFYCPVIDQALQNQGIGSISASEAPEVAAVTGVKLDQTTLTLEAGDSAQLTATVQPTNATNKSVTWSANNSNVSVSGGKVTAKTAGSSVVTVTTADGGYTAQCNVTVNESTATDHTELASLSLDGNCYFDTEIMPDENTNTKAKWNLQSGTTYIAGARDDNYKFGYTCTDNFYAVRGTVNSSAKPANYWNGDWIINQTGVSYQFGDTTVATDAIDSFALTSPYYLGNMSKNGAPAGTGVIGKIYYAQIYSGDTLQADMIPVKKSDGTVCLYDKIRKKYIYKSGNGTVTE